MTDFFDTKGIPDDPAYWDGLAARVSAGARAGSLARFAATPAAWAAALLLVTAAGLLVVAARGRENPDLGRELAQALAPADYPGGTLITTEDTSPLGALLLEPAASGGRP
jgi:hypothetical protein